MIAKETSLRMILLRFFCRFQATVQRRADTILDEFPYYSRIKLDNYWDDKTLRPIKIMNFFRIMKMVHLQFTD
jgi:hypothetical protein